MFGSYEKSQIFFYIYIYIYILNIVLIHHFNYRTYKINLKLKYN